MTGVQINLEDWGTELPAYLLFNIRIEDKGKVVGSGRDLEVLRSRFAGSARNRLRDALNKKFHADGVTAWSVGDLPERTRVDIGGRQVDGFPALIPQDGAVGLRVFETEKLARRHHRAGLKQLLLLSLPRKVKYLRRNLPLSEQAVLFYTPVASRDDLVEDLMSTAVERIFESRPLEARSLSEFEMLRAEVERELVREVTASCEQLDVILELFHRIRTQLDDRDLEIHVNALDDIHSQLSHLIHAGFLRDLSAERLKHYPRYLEGILLRLARLRNAPDKDSERMDELAPMWASYLEQANDLELNELRWLLEEMRISLFAQELKTAVPVSAKRLRKLLERAHE
jgi:ATP-dependent helicase HrpA